jgi:hypothetical protein
MTATNEQGSSRMALPLRLKNLTSRGDRIFAAGDVLAMLVSLR